jgi:hypothetical protein
MQCSPEQFLLTRTCHHGIWRVPSTCITCFLLQRLSTRIYAPGPASFWPIAQVFLKSSGSRGAPSATIPSLRQTKLLRSVNIAQPFHATRIRTKSARALLTVMSYEVPCYPIWSTRASRQRWLPHMAGLLGRGILRDSTILAEPSKVIIGSTMTLPLGIRQVQCTCTPCLKMLLTLRKTFLHGMSPSCSTATTCSRTPTLSMLIYRAGICPSWNMDRVCFSMHGTSTKTYAHGENTFRITTRDAWTVSLQTRGVL